LALARWHLAIARNADRGARARPALARADSDVENARGAGEETFRQGIVEYGLTYQARRPMQVVVLPVRQLRWV
jgi:hypothetical protein